MEKPSALEKKTATKRDPASGPALSKAKNVLPPLDELRKKETEEILNYILPPKEWEENGE